jgi:hypothetical protein
MDTKIHWMDDLVRTPHSSCFLPRKAPVPAAKATLKPMPFTRKEIRMHPN